MKFDFCIGNPPYNADFNSSGDNETYAQPVYNVFMDAANEVADKVELVHPARFLFNAGSTPKAWNKKVLNDPHFKVMQYEENASKIFPNTEIKGGVAITYRDANKEYGAIKVFTKYPELNALLKKVEMITSSDFMSSLVVNSYSYHFTDALHRDYPDAKAILSKGHEYDLKSNVLEKLPHVFMENKPEDNNEYIQILGRINNERVFRYIKAEYINSVINLWKYKVFLPAASGNGTLGETLSSPMVMGPGIGSTETFCSIGCSDTRDEADNILKYIKCKFTRALLSILKVTQHITPDKWKYVPMQDFSTGSDIDWSAPVKAIDQQLYKKYNLSEEEINFIETNVKEMT